MRGIDSLKSRELYSIGDGFLVFLGVRLVESHPSTGSARKLVATGLLSTLLSLSSMLSLLSYYIPPFILSPLLLVSSLSVHVSSFSSFISSLPSLWSCGDEQLEARDFGDSPDSYVGCS